MSEDTAWLVRRIRKHNGGELPRPSLYGKVYASDSAAAVRKFLETIKSGDNPGHFDAIPAKR